MGARTAASIVFMAVAIFAMIIAWAATHGILIIKLDKPFDLATVLFLAATLVVTGVGVAVAVVTLYGYEHIRTSAIDAARKEAEKVAKETAVSVAARTALEAVKTLGTTAEDAEGIAAAADDGGHDHDRS
ncbi:MAG TPA: hypothetical protein VEU53_13280 [Stellaceae bacterium]|nr:hypothetical protein [Stellaceae bacterium]